jgi:hypothetical protein
MESQGLEDLILLPAGNIKSDGTLTTQIALSAIDPSHPSIPLFLKNELLRSRNRNQFIDDALATGHIKEVNGRLIFKTQRPFPSFLGYMIEAYVVRQFNTSPETTGHAAKLWAANLAAPSSITKEYKAVGTGFHTTKIDYPGLHSNSDSMDIKFVKKRHADANDNLLLDHLMVSQSTQPAGIQIKAITGNEKTEIIIPLMSGRYLNVLTCLEHPDGMHSYEACMEVLHGMRTSREVSELEYHRIKNAVHSPMQLGIYQVDINYYCKYAKELHGKMSEAGVEVSRLYDEEKDIATIEVANYTRRNGILVPDNLDAVGDIEGNSLAKIQFS